MQRISLITLLLTSLSFSAFALDRTMIAEGPQDVTPLLIGQKAPHTTLQTVDGDPVSLQALVMQKPTVLIFYRGGWCPYCNRQLAGLKDIEGKLGELGYQILAISPETPAQLQAQKLQTQFSVRLLSDPGLDTIRGFGIGFYLPLVTEKLYEVKMGITLTDDKESGKAVLPAPAVFILDKAGIVKFSHVNADYKVRLSPELLYQAAKLSM
ncbi:MAG: peroxiredoxin [Paraglaciecola sp.]|jgi:peroxiredoxin